MIDSFGVDHVLGVLEPFVSRQRQARIEEVLQARLASIAVVLENLHDPHNGAAVFRSAEALGLGSIHIVSDSSFCYSKKVSIGCEKWLSVNRHARFADCSVALSGIPIYGLVPGARQTIEDVDVSQPFAVAFGNEHEGLSTEALEQCHKQVSIPMYGFSQSFNVSVSVAIALQVLTARRRCLLQSQGDLTEDEQGLLRAKWYVQSVRSAAEILARSVSSGTQ